MRLKGGKVLLDLRHCDITTTDYSVAKHLTKEESKAILEKGLCALFHDTFNNVDFIYEPYIDVVETERIAFSKFTNDDGKTINLELAPNGEGGWELELAVIE